MDQATSEIRTGRPALPTLVGVQGLVVAVLVLMFIGATADPEVEVTDIERRLLAVDVPRARGAITSALEAERSDTALEDADVLRVTSFLALAGQAAGLTVDDISIEPVFEAGAPESVEVVEAVIDVSGDLYDLPIFVDGAHRQRAMGALQFLAFDVAPGGATKGRIHFRYHRPMFWRTDWIGPRLALAAPGVSSATPLLIDAADLIAWRDFNASDDQRTRRAIGARSRAARELPPNLVELRKTGGRFVWDADGGIEIR
jgi:hypothetical protein